MGVTMVLHEKKVLARVVNGFLAGFLSIGLTKWVRLLVFEREEQRRQLILSRFTTRRLKAQQARIFEGWAMYVDMAQHDKQVLTRVVNGFLAGFLSISLTKWVSLVDFERQEQRRQLVLSRFTTRRLKAQQARIFESWVMYVDMVLHDKQVLTRVVNRFLAGFLSISLTKWVSLVDFEKKEQRRQLVLSRFTTRRLKAQQARIFESWVMYVDMAQHDKQVLTRVVNGFLAGFLSISLTKWVSLVDFERKEERRQLVLSRFTTRRLKAQQARIFEGWVIYVDMAQLKRKNMQRIVKVGRVLERTSQRYLLPQHNCGGSPILSLRRGQYTVKV